MSKSDRVFIAILATFLAMALRPEIQLLRIIGVISLAVILITVAVDWARNRTKN